MEDETRLRAGSVPLLPILSVNFIGTLGFSIVLPFLVFLVTRWGGNALIYGVVGATYSVFQLVGAPILGRMSDVHGRRKILLLSQVGTLVSWVILFTAFFLPTHVLLDVDSGLVGTFTLTLPLLVLFIARALDGLTGGNISVANAYLADVTPEEQRTANFGKMAVSTNLGFIVGPAIAGLLSTSAYGERLPVAAAMAISLVAALIIAFRLPESIRCTLASDPERTNVRKVFGQESRSCVELAGEKLTVRAVLRLDGVPRLLALNFLVMLGFNFFYISFPIYSMERLEWSAAGIGGFFAIMSLSMVIVQGPVLGWAAKRWSERRLVLVGSLLLAAAFFLFASRNVGTLYAAVGLMALGNGLMWPSVVAALSKAAGRHQGTVQGISGSAGAVASILGLVVGGLLYERFEARIFLLAGVIILVAFGMALRLPRGRT